MRKCVCWHVVSKITTMSKTTKHSFTHKIENVFFRLQEFPPTFWKARRNQQTKPNQQRMIKPRNSFQSSSFSSSSSSSSSNTVNYFVRKQAKFSSENSSGLEHKDKISERRTLIKGDEWKKLWKKFLWKWSDDETIRKTYELMGGIWMRAKVTTREPSKLHA